MSLTVRFTTHCSTITALIIAPLSADAAVMRQAQRDANVDAIFAQWDKPDSPGCAVGVVRDGELIYTRGYGVADLETGKPLGPDVVFYLASVSKQFTASSVAMLSLDGRMSLDDDVHDYVPELPSYGERISIRHMLHHTSGLRDYLTLMGMADMSLEDAWTPTQILALVSRQRHLNFPPGDMYLYSNTGYFLIPIIVERVTGTSFRAFADERIFRPLAMHDTHFHDDHAHEVHNRAFSYRTSDSGGFERSFLDKFDQVGSGGVLSTVRDLAKWDANFYTGTVGGIALLDLLHTPAVLNSGDSSSYALGLRIGDYKGLRTVAHSGSMMGFRTELIRFPDDRFSVICLCNLGDIDPGALARRVADVYLHERIHALLSELAGSYHSDELDHTWTIVVEGPEIAIQRSDEPNLTLDSRGDDTYRTTNGVELTFTRNTNGRVIGFVADGGRARGLTFEKKSQY